jgi:RNA polymerase sigma factor (sigma-70 family)
MSARLRIMTDEGSRSAPAEDAPGLLDAALQGDPGAWSSLITRHTQRVTVSLLGRGVPLDRARELTQETWLRLMERQREGKLTELSLPGLAIVQAGFLAANEHRRRDVGTVSAGEAESAAPDALRTVIGRERLRRIARALEACPPGARRVFERVYDHPELSYAEVATWAGLSIQRVKQIVFEVRQRLRAALAEEESR